MDEIWVGMVRELLGELGMIIGVLRSMDSQLLDGFLLRFRAQKVHM